MQFHKRFNLLTIRTCGNLTLMQHGVLQFFSSTKSFPKCIMMIIFAMKSLLESLSILSRIALKVQHRKKHVRCILWPGSHNQSKSTNPNTRIQSDGRSWIPIVQESFNDTQSFTQTLSKYKKVKFIKSPSAKSNTFGHTIKFLKCVCRQKSQP